MWRYLGECSGQRVCSSLTYSTEHSEDSDEIEKLPLPPHYTHTLKRKTQTTMKNKEKDASMQTLLKGKFCSLDYLMTEFSTPVVPLIF